jgi:hypothetical protein
MGDPSQRDQEKLRALARERVERGLLPRTKAARTWGGRGRGLLCSLCDTPILETEPEMELEYEAPESHSIHFHLQCLSAWEVERHGPCEPLWTDLEQQLPPLEHTVEARLTLSGGRSIILSIMRTCDRDSGATLWLNATTNTALPENWRPREWRFPPGHEPPVTADDPLVAPRRA